MDSKKINELLQQVKTRQYKVKVGESFSIELPKIAMTENTEFLQLVTETEGGDCLTEEVQNDAGEGNLQPREIKGIGRKVGKIRYKILAVDALSQKEIEGVAPLDIDLEVTE